jgi:hypothetical protein
MMKQPPIAGQAPQKGIPIFELWKKYEDIAMHFNDLLIRLRMQALAGVAALATVVSIFTKIDTQHIQGSWEIAAGVLGALCMFWIAIWVLDLCYYNRLLIGSVVALMELEEASKSRSTISEIEMSTRIEEAVWNKLPRRLPAHQRLYLLRGVWAFYSIVFCALMLGFAYSICKAQPAFLKSCAACHFVVGP